MLVSQNVLDTLKQIGLNLYERKLWVSLLMKGTSTAGELAELAKVPRSRSYDVLESLAEKGFLIVQTAKPLKYVAIPPAEALERSKKKLKTDFETLTKRIDDLKSSTVLKELEKVYKEGITLIEPGELSGSLRGRDSMNQQLETLFKSAKSKISIVTTSKGLAELHENHFDVLKKASNKGVKIKIASSVGGESAEVARSLRAVADVRKVGSVNGRFALVDGKSVVFALTDDKDVHPTQDLSFWTQSDHVASDVMEPMFNLVWKEAEAL